ncbi:hypothetical protein [uncultured Sunxiuqinia sp.]|uniref:sialidase family protein n=1 Tax=uncultured Sunxiuqinia sp. TaxID=1573825 RepID=UPI0026303145|nr:hypothetical protein [uncultured Sunxiuqinia sp.]
MNYLNEKGFWHRIVRKCLFLGILMIVGGACDRYVGPATQSLIKLHYVLQGDQQVGLVGEYLDNKVGLQLMDQLHQEHGNYPMELEVLTGGGQLDDQRLFSNAEGQVFTGWKLGDTPGKQMARLHLFSRQGELLNQVDLTAYALKKQEWSEVDFEPHNDFEDVIFDVENQLTLAVAGCKLYKQGAQPYHWSQVYVEGTGCNVSSLEIDSQGNIYRVGWRGPLFRSSDQGESWQELTHPYGADGAFDFHVSENDYLWAFSWQRGIKHSVDGGQTWIEDYEGMDPMQELVDVCSLADGTIFLLTQVELNYTLHRSTNGGTVWEVIEQSPLLQRLYLTEENELIKLMRDQGYNAFYVYKSADAGLNWQRVFQDSGHTNYRENQIFVKVGEYYYMAVVVGGVYRTHDFMDFEKVSALDIRQLFADHRGNLLGMGGWYHDKAYYYLQ